MKLRLQANSARFRLKRGEVAGLMKEGYLEERIVFACDQVLLYRIELSHVLPAPDVSFRDGNIVVRLPAEMALRWGIGGEVGIDVFQAVDHELRLRILIEKDFACLNGPEAENIDTFPNPQAGTAC